MDRGMSGRKSCFERDIPNKIPLYKIPLDLKIVLSNNLKPWHTMSEESKLYLERLMKFKEEDDFKLTKKNYVDDFHLLLYEESFRNELEMEEFNIYKQQITRNNEYNEFQIYVESLEEERPKVTINDAIAVIDTEIGDVNILRVIKVLRRHIIAEGGHKFCNAFSENTLYNIKFIFNTYSFRCCHCALDLYFSRNLKSYVFPTLDKSETLDNPSNNKLVWFNKDIENNPRQKQAVLNIVDRKNLFPAPYILYGPPGTGKTATVVEAICQASKQNPSDRILVCTPSNASADVIAKRLIKYVPKNNLHRMYSLGKDPFSIDDEILDFCNCSILLNGERKMVIWEAKCMPKIIIATLCTSTRLLLLRFPLTDFPYIFIDEAGQATEPETLIPFSLCHFEGKKRKIILAGDPQQLGPVIKSKIAKPVLGKSMLERMMTLGLYRQYNNSYRPRYITKLIQNYRSHPTLIHVSNKLFYNNELKACGDQTLRKAEGWRMLTNKQFPILFNGVVGGKEDKSKLSPSSYNEQEMDRVWYYVQLLIGSKLGNTIVKEENIGVITPFTGQKIRIREMFQDGNLPNVEVGTIELFQGKEKEIIILSTVRSEIFNNSHIGFLNDPKRFNVAVTRAKSLFITIGHPVTLQVDYNWWYLLDYCCRNSAYVPRYDSFRLKAESEFRHKHPKRSKHNQKKTINKKNIPTNAKINSTDLLLSTENRFSLLFIETHRPTNNEANNVIDIDKSQSSKNRSYKKCNVRDNTTLLSPIDDDTNCDNYVISKLWHIFKNAKCSII